MEYNGKKLSEANPSISTETIRTDIADTEAEIRQYERKEEGYRLIGDKLSVFKADAYSNGIRERKNFTRKLKAILDYRESGADHEK